MWNKTGIEGNGLPDPGNITANLTVKCREHLFIERTPYAT
jgi:hypothetical protein